MVIEIFHGARWLDSAIASRVGPTYNAVLGIGLVIEIVRDLRDFDLPSGSPIRAIFAVALFSFLLLHQMAELSEHLDRRRKRGGQPH
jgi:hypothetical protein